MIFLCCLSRLSSYNFFYITRCDSRKTSDDSFKFVSIYQIVMIAFVEIQFLYIDNNSEFWMFFRDFKYLLSITGLK